MEQGSAAGEVAPEIEPQSSAAAVEEAEERRESEAAPSGSAISGAIDQVNRVISELQHALTEMEEVLETLELAERQKIDDEREIESLQRALRQLHRPGR